MDNYDIINNIAFTFYSESFHPILYTQKHYFRVMSSKQNLYLTFFKNLYSNTTFMAKKF